jgi:U6 snRNA-associated Sm-like protein LSm1
LPGTASLLEELDKRLMVLLRDGRTLIGYLRSVDQFANLVLHRCIERIHARSDYGDIPRGVFIVRGENVVLLGEIDEDKESQSSLKEVSLEEILEAQSKNQAEKEKDIINKLVLQTRMIKSTQINQRKNMTQNLKNEMQKTTNKIMQKIRKTK